MRMLTKLAASAALLGLAVLPTSASTLTNWARAGVATQSSTYNGTAVASRAIDGNTAGAWGDNSTTHTATGDAGEWWQVDLKEVRPIGHIHLWFREDCCFDRNEALRVVVYDKADVATRVVVWETNNLAWPVGGIPRDIGFDLEPGLGGQVVYVDHVEGLPQYVCLTEVEVFDQALASPTNYALSAEGGVATSSSCYVDDCLLYGAQQANDGSHHGLTSVFPWAYSAPYNGTDAPDLQPWWRVDLAAPQTVGSVVLWPRRDRTYTRFQNIRLTVADATDQVLYQQLFEVVPSGPKFVVNLVPPVANAQNVKIETTEATPDKFLNLPEVEVFAPHGLAPVITFTTDLQPVTVEQNRPAVFGPVAAGVDGGIRPEDISYRWYRNGAEIPNMAGSWLSGYTTPYLAGLANQGDKFKVQASVSGHGVFSTEVELTVLADVTPPLIESHSFTVTDQVRINLVFSEMMDAATASHPANYVLAGGPTLADLTLGADQKTVSFVVENILLGDVIDLTVSGVKDLAGNVMAPDHIVAASPQEPINYARAGVARQDSDYGGGNFASRAIDGNTAGTWGAASIACTSGNIPGWWEVDLLEPRTIGIVKIYWRTDCCPRNANEDLVVYDKADEATRVEVARISISNEDGLGSAPFTLDLGGSPLTGQVVRLEHRPDTPTGSDGGALQMCLAEVMLLPPPTGLQITTSPRSWTVYEGDRVLLRSATMGTAPITYRWQRDGSDVPGATDANLTIEKITAGQAGVYTLVAQNAIRTRTSSPATVVVKPRPSLGNSLVARYLFEEDAGTTVLDSAPMNPSKTVMHDAANNGAWWVASVDGRDGVMQFDGTTAPYSVIEAISHPDFDGPNTNQPLTITLWMKAPDCSDLPGNSGAMLFDRLSGAQGYGAFSYQVADALGNNLLHSLTGGYAVGTHPLGDDTWHHVALVYAHVPYSIGLAYVDGVLDTDAVYDLTGSWPTFRNLMIGGSWDGWWKHFNGYMDDIFIFNRMLDAAEVNEVKAGLSLPPSLSYTLQGDQLTISWSAVGFILQENGNAADPAGWKDIPGATTGTLTITVPASGHNFYRLKK